MSRSVRVVCSIPQSEVLSPLSVASGGSHCMRPSRAACARPPAATAHGAPHPMRAAPRPMGPVAQARARRRRPQRCAGCAPSPLWLCACEGAGCTLRGSQRATRHTLTHSTRSTGARRGAGGRLSRQLQASQSPRPISGLTRAASLPPPLLARCAGTRLSRTAWHCAGACACACRCSRAPPAAAAAAARRVRDAGRALLPGEERGGRALTDGVEPDEAARALWAAIEGGGGGGGEATHGEHEALAALQGEYDFGRYGGVVSTSWLFGAVGCPL